jgi:hypothetical protein
MQLSSRNPWLRFAALLIVVIVIAVAWYLISPLFLDVQVNEGFPTLAQMPTKTPRATVTPNPLGFDPAQATAEMLVAMEADPAESDDPMPAEAAEMTILVQGSFYNVAHEGEGTATIYQLADGSRLLRFENFSVLNGPELHVYLAPQDPVADTVGVELAGAIDLGDLKGNIGDQNYEIDAGIDLSLFESVVIWCQPFRVPFSAASLQTP